MVTNLQYIYRLKVGDRVYEGTMDDLEVATFYCKNVIWRVRQKGKLGKEKATLEIIEKRCPKYNIYEGRTKEKLLYKEKGSRELAKLIGCCQSILAQYANKYYPPKNCYIERLH